MLLISHVSPAQAADKTALPSKTPDMALLEYLAELVEVDGQLVGPMDMAAKKPPQATIQAKEDKDEQGQNQSPPDHKNQDKPTKELKDEPTAEEGKHDD